MVDTDTDSRRRRRRSLKRCRHPLFLLLTDDHRHSTDTHPLYLRSVTANSTESLIIITIVDHQPVITRPKSIAWQYQRRSSCTDSI